MDCSTVASTEVILGKADLAGSKPSKQSTGPAKRWKLTRLAFRKLRKGSLKRQDGQPTLRPRWETPGAASEFPSDLDLVDEEEQGTVSLPEEERILPSAPPLPPMEGDESRLDGTIARLRGQAPHQVRLYVAILARMRRNLTPSTRACMIKALGWHLGPAHETGGATPREHEPEPAWLLHGTGWVMNKLATMRRHAQQVQEEQIAAVQERLALLDDSLATAEEFLEDERKAGLRTWVKAVEQQLPVVAAQLGLLWKTVTGMGRPMPSDMQLTATGDGMTVEEHVATAETHLCYAEGHLQPTKEHLADGEVHLKLVRAHLATIELSEEVEMCQAGAVPPPAEETPLPQAEVALPPQEGSR